MVGFLVGFGELMGYALRSVSGYLADRSTRSRRSRMSTPELARRIDLGVVDLDFVCLGRGKLHRAPLSKQMVQLLERKV